MRQAVDAKAPARRAAADARPLHAPPGQLVVAVDGSTVLCYLCGREYRDFAGSHLRYAHGLDADADRTLVGVSPRYPLNSQALSARRSAVLRARLVSDPRISQAQPRPPGERRR